MARSYTISGSLITIEGDPFDEGKDDFLEVDLVDEVGEPIDEEAVSAITVALRSLDTGAAINDRDGEQDVLNENGGTLAGATLRLDLSGDGDLVSEGTYTMQRRELTLLVTHSDGKRLSIVVRFTLRAYADV